MIIFQPICHRKYSWLFIYQFWMGLVRAAVFSLGETWPFFPCRDWVYIQPRGTFSYYLKQACYKVGKHRDRHFFSVEPTTSLNGGYAYTWWVQPSWVEAMHTLRGRNWTTSLERRLTVHVGGYTQQPPGMEALHTHNGFARSLLEWRICEHWSVLYEQPPWIEARRTRDGYNIHLYYFGLYTPSL